MFAGRTPVSASRWVLSFRVSWRSFASSLQQETLDTVRDNDEDSDFNWEKLGFSLVPTDYMYVMRCSQGQKFSAGVLNPFGNIELSPSSGVLKSESTPERRGRWLLALQAERERTQIADGCAERMCMPSPTVEQFIHAVRDTVLANKRWVPPHGKGSLYIRPLLIGSGPVIGLAPAPDYMFLVYAAPVGSYFKEGLAPINLRIDDTVHRASPGGTGGVKTISNYAPVLMAPKQAKSRGFIDVVYLDPVNEKYLEETSSCNIFIVKGDVISTPATAGTILPGITRKSIIEIARDCGYKVDERLISVEELLSADEVFCTGTAVVVAPVGSVSRHGRRFQYRIGADSVSQKLRKLLTAIQMGREEDKKSWTVQID